MRTRFAFIQLLLLSALLAGNAAAQSWQMLYPQAGGFFTLDLQFVDDSSGWVIGIYPTTMMHTTDGGLSWRRQRSVPSRAARASFVDRNRGWMTTEDAKLYHTTDGGETWSFQIGDDRENYGGVWFADSLHGWLDGAYAFYRRTTDGGLTWEYHDYAMPQRPNDFDAVDANHVWFAALTGLLMRSTDGGLTWERQVPSDVYNLALYSVFFLDTLNGWTVGGVWQPNYIMASPAAFRTTDGGLTWDSVATGAASNLGFTKVHFFDRDHGLITVIDHTYMLTTDGGQTWQHQSNTPPLDPNYFSRYSYPSWSNWWLATNSGIIERSTDQGASWVPSVHPLCDEIMDLRVADAQNAWICAPNQILHSGDGGDSWQVQLTDSNQSFMKLDFVSEMNGWAIGGHTNVLRTTNGGNSWTPYGGATYGLLRDVSFGDSLHGWIIGYDSFAAQSTDGGINWTAHWINYPQTWTAVECVDSLCCWLGNPAGDVIYSQNGGATWMTIHVMDQSISDICFVSRSEGWVIGAAGGIYHSINRGASWTSQNSQTTTALTQIEMKRLGNLTYGWVASDSALPRVTTNGGTTWRIADPGFGPGWAHVAFTDTQHVWLAGNYNSLIRYAPEISATPSRPIIADNFSLAVPYPNPFNNSTTIHYSLTTTAKICVDILDLTGRTVTVLVDGYQSLGNHAIVWNGSQCSSGMYFVRLRINDRETRVQKAILLK